MAIRQLRRSTTGSKPSEPHGRQRDATSPQSSEESKPSKPGRTARTVRVRRWHFVHHFGGCGSLRVMSTEGRSLKKPHERSPETGFLFRRESGEKGRAVFGVCCLQYTGLPKEAMDECVCGAGGSCTQLGSWSVKLRQGKPITQQQLSSCSRSRGSTNTKANPRRPHNNVHCSETL